MTSNFSDPGGESPGKSALTARRIVVAAGCCGYRSVRDSRSVSLSHPKGGGGRNPASGLTHRPWQPPSPTSLPPTHAAASAVATRTSFPSVLRRIIRRSGPCALSLPRIWMIGNGAIFRYAHSSSPRSIILFTRDLRTILEFSCCQ